MPENFRVELAGNWSGVQAALLAGRELVKEEAVALAEGAAEEAASVARSHLDAMVYEAPLPPSADSTWGGPEHYLERSRLGRTRDAIDSKTIDWGVEGWAAVAEVKREDYEAFFYALALEYGMNHGANQYRQYEISTYYPRPFMRMTAQEMRARYLAEGMRAVLRVQNRFAAFKDV